MVVSKLNKSLFILPPVVLILVIILLTWIFVGKKAAVSFNDLRNLKTVQKSTPAQNNKTDKPFDKNKNSITDPSSIWVVVNKINPIRPNDYAPSDLVVPDILLRNSSTSPEMLVRSEAASALKKMSDAANAESIGLRLASGYRSYGLQIVIYNNYVKTQGQAVADSQSARAGFSEHQTGLTVDLEPANRKCEIADCFADTAEGKWLAANAYKHGFILRYPPDSQPIVGYKYEPWHFRYVGTELSNEMNKTGQKYLERFFGLPDAPDYN